MASMFELSADTITLLDPGAGTGILTENLVANLCARKKPPRRISVTGFEMDAAVICALRNTYDRCAWLCSDAGIHFESEVHNEDFIAFGADMTRDSLFATPQRMFNAVITNPPYRKIQSDSRARMLLRSAGIETSNLYTGFLALAAKLLADDGEMVAITPRSFCNGTYFKPFRQMFLEAMSLRRLHVFQSRSKTFREAQVLQENIILHAVKSTKKPASVILSTDNLNGATQRQCSYAEVVSPRDPESFIHFVTSDAQESSRQRMKGLQSPLEKLEIEVSTGRVVDFRARDLLAQDESNNTFPLIYPCHFNGGFIDWPKPHGRKPNAIRTDALQRDLLVPSGIYVLVKRFSTKEEKKRVVACIYDGRKHSAPWVGFENHLNYFHQRGNGLTLKMAKGLTAFLNSTVVDQYFRQFNGHTQVNATDLRNIKYPSRASLEALGSKIGSKFPGQEELDALVEKELF